MPKSQINLTRLEEDFEQKAQRVFSQSDLVSIFAVRRFEWNLCQSRMKIPHFAGRKFPTPQPYKAASLASDAVEPSAVLWRVLGATESEAKELDAARSCSRAGTSPALRRSFNR